MTVKYSPRSPPALRPRPARQRPLRISHLWSLISQLIPDPSALAPRPSGPTTDNWPLAPGLRGGTDYS